MSLRKHQIRKERSLDSGRVCGTVLSHLSHLLSLYLQKKCVSTRFITGDSGIISALCSELDFFYRVASSVKEKQEDESARVSKFKKYFPSFFSALDIIAFSPHFSKNYTFKTYSCKNEVPCLCKINEIISAPDGI